ncbi:hypothetical protein INR49_020823 [Caranx melampygus]|nr:hypothetical protein INR49_020823 [Caranx melampygus]
MVSSNDAEDGDNTKQPATSKLPVSMLVQLAANQQPAAAVHQANSTQATLRSSVYSSWSVNTYNPNPLNLSTKAALALLRSKQRRNTDLMFTTAAMSPPSSGKLVSSVAWKLRFDQLKPELMPVDVSHFGRKMKGVVSWDRSKEEQVEKEVYKSNEDYVYVRGRGRGKYICEECGIRCKKPSMLKKHIRTHTDVRPYVCKFCNFAFKTKGREHFTLTDTAAADVP